MEKLKKYQIGLPTKKKKTKIKDYLLAGIFLTFFLITLSVGSIYFEFQGYEISFDSIDQIFADDKILSVGEELELKIIYTFNTVTTPLGSGRTNLVIGGQLYADSNGTKIQDAVSLKDCEFCDNLEVVVNSDGTHLVDIIDYNYTSLIADFYYDKDNLGEFGSEIKDKEMTSKTKIILQNGSEIETEIKIIEDTKVRQTLDFGLGKEIHFGNDSTTIKLDEADNHTLEDTYARFTDPDANSGTSTLLVILNMSTEAFKPILKFNISMIPAGQQIDNATLSLYTTTNNLDDGTEGYNVSSHRVANQSWVETSVTWNNFVSFNETPTDDLGFTDSFPAVPIRILWEVGEIVAIDYGLGNSNTSILLLPHDVFGTPANNDYIIGGSKDTGVPADRPYLNITYSVFVPAGDTIFPNVTINTPQNLTYNTTTILFNITAVDETLMDSCWYSLDAGVTNITMINDTFVDDYTNTNSTMTQGSHTANFYCNDSTNNLNNTRSISFFIDSIFPNITFDSSTTTNGSTVEQMNVLVNVTSEDANLISTLINFNDDLIGWWRMDDANSSHVLDYIGNNDCKIKGNSIQNDSGVLGKSFTFDGASDELNCGNDSSLDFGTKNFTLSAWVKIVSSRFQYIVVREDYNNAPSLEFGLDNTDHPTMFIADTDWINDATAISADAISQNEWHHIVGTKNATHIAIYVDGLIKDTTDHTAVGSLSTPFNFSISGAPGSENWVNGSVDDVILFNRSLTLEEIRGLYANSSSKVVSRDFTNLADDNYTFAGYSQDIAGNINTTGIAEVKLELAPPYFPGIADQTIDNETALSYIVPVVDDGIGVDTIWINWTTNFTINSATGLLTNSSLLATGVYSINVSANDTLGQTNSTILTINVLDVDPDKHIRNLRIWASKFSKIFYGILDNRGNLWLAGNVSKTSPTGENMRCILESEGRCLFGFNISCSFQYSPDGGTVSRVCN